MIVMHVNNHASDCNDLLTMHGRTLSIMCFDTYMLYVLKLLAIRTFLHVIYLFDEPIENLIIAVWHAGASGIYSFLTPHPTKF